MIRCTIDQIKEMQCVDWRRWDIKSHLLVKIFEKGEIDMKKFEEPIVEVMNFAIEDVVTTSELPALIPPCDNG